MAGVKKVLSERRLRELKYEQQYAAKRRDEAKDEIVRLQLSELRWTERLSHWEHELAKLYWKLEGYDEDGLDS